MTEETLKKAISLTKEIDTLECFMFWCSGKRTGLRRYPAALMKIKRSSLGGIESKEYELPARLQEKICDCIQEELDLLKAERNKL